MSKPKLIVAIGASAGGLEALESFFKHLPEKTDMAFVVIMHLDPHHVSILPELLQRQTKMAVVKIESGTTIQPNTLYVIPPNHNLSLLDAQFQLFELPKSHSTNLPIDNFFKALAQDQTNRAVAIILSGTGSDGSQGLKEIKAEDGMVIVQDENSAVYDGMPRNAKATGMADFILSPDKMPEKLMQYVHQQSNPVFLPGSKETGLKDSLQKILSLIRDQTGNDFSLYKKNTIFRRIERRMYVHQIKDINDYLYFLQKNEQEIDILFRELLIGVTSFFRDPEAFDVLQTTVLPELLKNKSDDEAMRLWVAGCSTGEEAYSIAICLHECLITLKRNLKVQIFATDIDDKAIEIARNGLYSANIVSEMSEDYCKRYFTKEGNQFRIKKPIRETLVFATQNLIKDPPFTKLDLICCRNLLIYFSSDLQKKIFPIFDYSLNEGGILFLGPSETTGQGNQYFKNVDKKWKIFKRKAHKGTEMTRLNMPDSSSLVTSTDDDSQVKTAEPEANNIIQLVEAVLSHSQVPSCVVIDKNKNIIYVHGRLGCYLEPAEGHLSNNILDMARTARLKNELLSCINLAESRKEKVQKKALNVQTNGEETLLDLSVIPLEDLVPFKRAMMVVFEQIPKTPVVKASRPAKGLSVESDTVMLQQELDNTRNNLQSTIQDLETSNEELQSTNEELQSTNEELETSKEELQSLNEESTTVNVELQNRIDELFKTNNDIRNLLDSTQMATLFLDTELKIRRFTPKMTEIINLLPTDINRPIEHFSSCLNAIKITDYASQVLKTLDKIEMEVNDDKGKYYKMRVLPYRTSNNVIDGIVITFEDITTLKSIELSLRKNEQRYKSLFDNCPVTVVEINLSGLADYLYTHQLKDTIEIDRYLKQNPDEKKHILSLIKVVNINNMGLELFESESKSVLLPQIPQLIMNHGDYLAHLLNMIAEQKEHTVLSTSLTTTKEARVDCTMTSSIPKLGAKLNFNNCIITIVKCT